MTASKENAAKAEAKLSDLSDAIGPVLRTQHSGKILFIAEFLESALRKLPTEAAFEKDKRRKASAK